MKESGFSISDPQKHFVVEGGNLWEIRSEKSDCLELNQKHIRITLRPADTFEKIFEELQGVIKELSPLLSFRLSVRSRLAPLVLVIPAIILILFIGTVGAYGNLINELISLGEGETQLGISKYQLFYIQTTLYIIGAYAFPLFFQGDYDGTISTFKALTDNEQVMKSRLKTALVLLQKRKYLERVEVWNPDIVSESHLWIREIFLPAIVDSQVPLTLQVKVEEQFVARSLLEKLTEHHLEWNEHHSSSPNGDLHPIPLEFLKEWEQEMLQVLSAASTVHLPTSWKSELENHPAEGSLENVISLSLAKVIVGHFRNRLFSSQVAQPETSVNLFVGRCVNDYGIMQPLTSYELDMYQVAEGLLEPEIKRLKEERNYILPFLEGNAGNLIPNIQDAAGVVILAGTHSRSSIYNENKRKTVEGFIRITASNEKFNILRAFWNLVIQEEGTEREANPEKELYRLLDTALLKDLVLAFRRAGMYDKTDLCYKFLSAIYPVESSIGEAVVLSELGKYEDSIQKFLSTRTEDVHAKLSLNLFMCVVIVMNQLRDHKQLAENSLDLIGKLLAGMKDGKRDTHHLARYYNVLASYQEWTDNYALAVETYEKGLSIPGVDRSLISSIMVNKGIAYRFIGKEKTNEKEAIFNLREGIRYNFEGVDAKEVIGNVDQLPIALHNLAETCIELAYRLPEGKEKIDFFKQGYSHSQKGLTINDQINSVKKRGQLLVERYLSAKNLSGEGVEAEIEESLCGWIRENVQNKGYDIDVVLDLLKRIGGFSGASLEEVLQEIVSG